MVGTLKSTGCAICRKRKKKCGEELPECSSCLKAGWKCPGYATRWKFVDENRPLSVLYRKKKYIFEDIDQANCASLGSQQELDGWDARSAVGLSLTMPCQQTCLALCYILEDSYCRAGFPIKAHGSFYTMIPARLGHLRALDDAVSSLCSLYTDSFRGSTNASEDSIRLYAQSLQSLRTGLSMPQARATAETICASIILQLCELIMNEEGGGWNQLRQGTRLLIQESGPEEFVKPFGRAMLESQRAWFILHDASTEQECFLSRAEWRKLLGSSRPTFDNEPLSISLRAQLCEFLVDAPKLLRNASRIIAQISSGETLQIELIVRRQNMVRRISSLKQTLEWWYSTNVLPIRPNPSELRSNELKVTSDDVENQDILAAVIDCVSNSLLIRLEIVLHSLNVSSTGASIDSSYPQAVMTKRQKAMFTSLDYVRKSSSIAAKPLEFGLQQLWLDAGLEPSNRTPTSRPFFRGHTTP